MRASTDIASYTTLTPEKALHHISALSERRHPSPMTIMSSDSSAALKRERDAGEQTVVAVKRPVYDQFLHSRLGAIR